MITSNLKIKAFINPKNGQCSASDLFRKEWIGNDKLDPFVKQIPVISQNVSAMAPRVELTINGNVVWKKYGAHIDAAKLEEFILSKYKKG